MNKNTLARTTRRTRLSGREIRGDSTLVLRTLHLQQTMLYACRSSRSAYACATTILPERRTTQPLPRVLSKSLKIFILVAEEKMFR